MTNMRNYVEVQRPAGLDFQVEALMDFRVCVFGQCNPINQSSIMYIQSSGAWTGVRVRVSNSLFWLENTAATDTKTQKRGVKVLQSYSSLGQIPISFANTPLSKVFGKTLVFWNSLVPLLSMECNAHQYYRFSLLKCCCNNTKARIPSKQMVSPMLCNNSIQN